MTDTRRDLMENFDAEVHERLKLSRDESAKFLNQLEKTFWILTKIELSELYDGKVTFDDENCEFSIMPQPVEELWLTGVRYRFLKYLEGAEHVHGYSLNHKLAEHFHSRGRRDHH